MSMSKRIPPTVPPIIAVIGIRCTARDDDSDNVESVVVSLEDSERELEDVGVSEVGGSGGGGGGGGGGVADKRNKFSSAEDLMSVCLSVDRLWHHAP